jgi:hypothetical protein
MTGRGVLTVLTALLAATATPADEGSPFRQTGVEGTLVRFAGSAVLEGYFTYAPSNPFTGGEVCFRPDNRDAALLPVVNGSRRTWFCFTNAVRARELLGIPAKPERGACRIAGRARVVIDGYVADTTESEVFDGARLLRVKHSALEPQPREPERRVREGAAVVFETPLTDLPLDLLDPDAPVEVESLRLRTWHALIRPGADVYLFSAKSVKGPWRLVQLDWRGKLVRDLALPWPEPDGGASPSPGGVVDGGDELTVVLSRWEKGPKASAAVFSLGAAGDARLSRVLDLGATPPNIVVLPGGAVLREGRYVDAAGRDRFWSLYAGSAGPKTVTIPDRKSAPVTLDRAVLFSTRQSETVRVGDDGTFVRVRGCEICNGKQLVGGAADIFGCIATEREWSGERTGWSYQQRALHLCRLQQDGAGLPMGSRSIEPAAQHEDGCHFRVPQPGHVTIDAKGNAYELEISGAPQLRLRLVRYAAPAR